MTITSTYDNKKVELVYNEHFLCLTRDVAIIDLDLGPNLNHWKLQIIFNPKENVVPFATEWKYNTEGIHLQLTLFNWVSSTSTIELKKPVLITTRDGSKSFYFKIATTGRTDAGRDIHISVWKIL